MSYKNKQQGFTIVELLIVIVVISILALLVITTFTGIQQKARNTERETDIKAIHGQVEAYYASKGYYPTLENLNTDAWRAENMKGLDKEALKDPKTAAEGDAQYELADAAPTAPGVYSYVVTDDDGDDCEEAPESCSQYTLTAAKEGNNAGTFSKSNLN